jgi:uncharacterized membrane protein HdeD (DUF308 family)
MLDLRYPAGGFFALLGLILAVLGLVSTAKAPLTDVNVNLWTGVVMLVFGLILLALALRAKRNP